MFKRSFLSLKLPSQRLNLVAFFIFLMPAKELATILDIVVELDSSPLAFYSSCAPLNGHVFKLDVAH